MSRYSSDSDSSSRRRKSRRRRSRSSSSSSSSHHKRSRRSKRHSSSYKKSKSYSRKRHKSHSRKSSNSRHSRSVSKDRRHTRSRSRSRDKYKSKHHKSRSHSKGHTSKHRSRSSSNDTHSRHSKSPACSNSSSSSGSKKRATSNPVNVPNNADDQLREKLLKAIKAAESADHQLKQQGVLAKSIKSRNDLNTLAATKPQGEVIKAIERDEFVPKSFTSSKGKKANTEDVAEGGAVEVADGASDIAADSIFHASIFCDPKIKLDKWVKKLYQIRQRAITGEPMAT